MVLVRKNQKAYFDQFVESKEYLFITGLMISILGAIIVALNNIWTFDWRLLITILGWVTFLKGAMMLILPESSVSIWKKLSVKPWILLMSGVLYLIIAIFLIWIGFGL
jgi:threonine/homoserine/homoserine lactone efflux protein